MMPKITIITSTFNGERYIKETIESVLGQTFTDFEYIIINDASTDKTLSLIEDYAKKDTRIRIITNENNIERSASRNKGIISSNSEYIAFIDDDDIWEKEKLFEQLEFLEANKEYILCGTNAVFVDNKKAILGTSQNVEEDEMIRSKLLSYNPFIFSSIMIRKKGISLFDEKINMAEDYDFILKNGTHGKLKNLKPQLVEYRVGENSSLRNQFKLRYNCIKNCLKYRKDYPNFKKSLFLWVILFFIPYKFVKFLNMVIPTKIKRFFF